MSEDRGIYTLEHAKAIKDSGRCGESYGPSNGSEGEMFMSRHCAECKYDAKYQRTQDGKDGCKIIVNTHAYDVGDPKYPKQWIYGQDGQPTCTKFALSAPRKKLKFRPPMKGDKS